MNGKVFVIALLGTPLIVGASIYYQQVYGFYDTVEPTGPKDVQIVLADGGAVETVAHSQFQAIDGSSSPIRYRACFNTSVGLDEARARYVAAPEALPRNAPGWFDCFDAAALGGEIEAGTATTFMSQMNISYGVDRVVAITQDGRGYIWHTLNNCGETDYTGTRVGEVCPPRPDEGE
jgi:hypothetical protein